MHRHLHVLVSLFDCLCLSLDIVRRVRTLNVYLSAYLSVNLSIYACIYIVVYVTAWNLQVLWSTCARALSLSLFRPPPPLCLPPSLSPLSLSHLHVVLKHAIHCCFRD
jgi:hypothetical protein